MEHLLEETNAILSSNEFNRYHLGCGTNFLKGWLNINFWTHLDQGRLYKDPNDVKDTLLLNHDLKLGVPAEDNSLDAVYHSHMLEHIAYEEGLQFLQKIYNALKPGGIHRLLVPDLQAFAKAYLSDDDLLLRKYQQHVLGKKSEIYQTKAAIFMGMLHNHEHKMGYDYETLHWALNRIGFKNIKQTLFQESALPDIKTIEYYEPVRAMESLCIECNK